MGPKQSTTTTNQPNQTINHPKFNNPNFYKGSDDVEYFDVKMPIVNEKEYSAWASRLNELPLNRN